VDAHQRYEHRILDALDADETVSQRSLATSLGIALGLTNLLVRRVVRKGWVRVRRVRSNRVRYILTPAGIAEKSRLSRLYLRDAVSFYVMARDRVRESLARAGGPSTRIVFLGTGEIAEIAYICLRETHLELVGVVALPGDPEKPFFGIPVHRPEDVRDGVLVSTSFDRLVVTSFDHHDLAQCQIETLGVSPQRVHWL
jgi:DNA-binding MarR family transcriptional regulator